MRSKRETWSFGAVVLLVRTEGEALSKQPRLNGSPSATLPKPRTAGERGWARGIPAPVLGGPSFTSVLLHNRTARYTLLRKRSSTVTFPIRVAIGYRPGRTRPITGVSKAQLF